MLLNCYQEALAHILQARDIPGISANDLESFRARSRSSAYTCRLRLCPRATIGFDSAEARDEHEVAHTRRFPCSIPSCQYPPFTSSQKLKRHMRERHSTGSSRRQIRQPHTRAQRETDVGITMESPAGELLRRTDNGPQSTHHYQRIRHNIGPPLNTQTQGAGSFDSQQQEMGQQLAAPHAQGYVRAAQAESLQNAAEEMPDKWEILQDPAIKAMVAQLDPEQRQRFYQLSPEKLLDLFSKWNRRGMLRPGQRQQGAPMNIASLVEPTGGATAEQPKENPMDLMLVNTSNDTKAQVTMDDILSPLQVNQMGPVSLPKKRGHSESWISRTDTPVPDAQKPILRVPPGTPIPEVTPQEIQQFRTTQGNFEEGSDDQIRVFLQRLKLKRMPKP